MPEIKNTFTSGKMNKDLDERLVPNGQYRDGQNVQISRSEGDDVGALENVLGNELLSNFGLTNSNLEIIGHLTNDTLDCIFLFLTDYADSSPDQLSNNIAGIAGECYIIQYTFSTNSFRILVEGNFLNFSTSHPIIGVTLLESLLFWTDNRNQPRKINIINALSNQLYYTTEDQISVAKYYPYNPICLLENVYANTFLQDANHPAYNSGMKDVVSKYLPIHTSGLVTSVPASTTFSIEGEHFNIQPEQATSLRDGDLITSDRIDSVVTVDGITIGTGTTSFTFHSEFHCEMKCEMV